MPLTVASLVQAFTVSKQLCDSIKQEQSIVMTFLRKVGFVTSSHLILLTGLCHARSMDLVKATPQSRRERTSPAAVLHAHISLRARHMQQHPYLRGT